MTDWDVVCAEKEEAGFVFVRAGSATTLESLIGRIGGPYAGPFESEVDYVRFDPSRSQQKHSVANSSLEMYPHTDGSFEGQPPTDVILQCVVEDAPAFGRTVLVDLRDVIRGLGADIERLLRCSEFRFFRREASRVSSVIAPIISGPSSVPLVRYREDSKYHIETPSRQYTHALAAFRDVVRSCPARFDNDLRPGDMVWIDNERILHGRSALSGRRLRVLRRARLLRDKGAAA